MEVAHQLADDGELLRVLLAEHREVGLHEVEELRHHRGDAAEVPRAQLALEAARGAARFDEGGVPGG